MAEWLRCQPGNRRVTGSNPTPSHITPFLHIENEYRNCKSLDFDSIRFDTVDSIEISMYRPNLNPHAVTINKTVTDTEIN